MEGIYELCFYGGLALAVIFFIVSVILFITLKIPKVVGDLTGRSARKDIREKQLGINKNESVSKKEKDKYYNQNTGKITVRETVSGVAEKPSKVSKPVSAKELLDIEDTEVLNAAMSVMEAGETEYLKPVQYGSEETSYLQSGVDGSEETSYLTASGEGSEETEYLKTGEYIDMGADSETDVLKVDGADSETDVLTSDSSEPETDVLISDSSEPETDVLKASGDIAKKRKGMTAFEETDVVKDDIDDMVTDVLRTNVGQETDDLREGVGMVESTPVYSRMGYDEDDGDSTTVLFSEQSVSKTSNAKVIYNVVVTHTNESI